MTVTHTPEGPSYRSIAQITVSGDGSAWAQAGSGARQRLTAAQHRLLELLPTFTPAQQLSQQHQVSRSELAALEDAGLIESDAAILRRCAALALRGELPPIADLGILTCGSPQLLRRSVNSWIAFGSQHKRNLRIVIADDSPDAARAGAQRAAARSLESETGVQLRLVDPASRLAIARELAALAGVDPDLAEFAVAGCPAPRIGIGGNRNLVNLLTRGRRVLSADDDIIAEFAAPPSHPLALWINSEDVPMHTYFFDSIAETAARVPVSRAADALALHEAFAGHDVASIVDRLSGPASLRDAQPALTNALQRGTVRVAATALGLVGDSASDCLAFFSMMAGGDTARNFLARASALSPSREVMRRPEFPVLCQGIYFITFCHAVDNRLPLPPYFPVGRGEDQAWQKLLHWSMPDTVVAHLPLAVHHRPEPARQYTAADYLDPCAIFPGNALLLGALGTCPRPDPPPGPDGNLAVMGRHLAELAGDPGTFSALVHAAWRAYLAYHRTLVVASRDSRPAYPQGWQADMAHILETLQRRMARDTDIPLEYAARIGPPAVEPLRQDLLRFARLLEAWPALRRAADVLSARLCEDASWLRP